MRKTDFKKFLLSLSESDLREELDGLFTKFKEVKEHYTLELGSDKDRKRFYDRAKKNIKAKYATRSHRRPKRPRIAKINAILKDLAKLSIFKSEMADLYFYNCETALTFMDDYWFYSEPLINHIFKSFSSGLNLVREDMVEEEFENRIEKVVTQAWNVNSSLGEALQLEVEEVLG